MELLVDQATEAAKEANDNNMIDVVKNEHGIMESRVTGVKLVLNSAQAETVKAEDGYSR